LKITVKIITVVCVAVLTIFAGASAVQGQEVQAMIVPDSVLVGDPVQLQITTNTSNAPRLVNLPQLENITWMSGSSQQTRIVNNSIENTVIYGFRVNKEGVYEIPSLKVKVGGKFFQTEKLTVKAYPASTRRVAVSDEPQKEGSRAERKLDDLIYGKGAYLADGNDFYVGEEIPAEISVFLQSDLNCEFTSWPEFNLDNVIFRDYSSSNKQNNRFEVPGPPSSARVDGLSYRVVKLRTVFRAISPGTLQPEAKITCDIKVPDRSSARRRSSSMFDDDFFESIMNGRSYRQVPHTIQIAFPKLTIKPLPPTPAGVEWLGLVGNWRVNYSLDKKNFKVGDAFTFKINITGSGAIETLVPPKLDIPGFRVYPPEINRLPATGGNNQNTELNYVMIPLKPGEMDLTMNTAIFSCPMDKYNHFEFNKKLSIAPNADIPQGGTTAGPVAAQEDQPVLVKPQITHRSQILYLKKNESGAVSVPLYLNYWWMYLLLVAGGPLVLAFREWRCKLNQHLENDPMLRRRRSAAANHSKIIRKLKSTGTDNINDVIQSDVVPWLNDLLELPPGTTATELTAKVSDPELKECLNNCGAANYLPGAGSIDRQELKKRIIRSCKRLTLALICCLVMPFAASAQTTPPVIKPKIVTVNNINDALNCYDNGDFKKAAEFFNKKINPNSPDPALLYNLGNCYCQLQNYPAALLCLERARLLAPNDSDITENLNFVRKKLFLPVAGEVNDPVSLMKVIRDNLRPDQWWLIIAAAWFSACIIVTYRRSLSKNKLIILLGLFAIAAAVAGTAVFTQYRGDYAGSLAVVMNNVKLRSLPSETTGQDESTIRSGSKINIIESRSEWSRVRHGDGEGWLKTNTIIPIAPGNAIP
jgi:tetratricopeptide (TPR) repeat protein